MKQLLLTLLFFNIFCVIGVCQKINKRTYMNVIRLSQYTNGEIIIYKDIKGVTKTDTLYYSRIKGEIVIHSVDEHRVYNIPIPTPTKTIIKRKL